MTSVPPARSSDAGHDPSTGPAAGGSAPESAAVGDPAASRSARTARRALTVTLLCGALGAALALVAGGRVWSHSTASFAQGALPVQAKGGDVTGLPGALALVGLAALVAVFAVRRASRYLVAGLLALCGVGTAVAALGAAHDSAPLAEKAAKVSGIEHSGIGTVQVGVWPYVSAAGGVLLLCAGLLALRYGRGWPSMSGSGRYDRAPRRPRGAPVPMDPDRPEDLWKALDRGEDPTRGAV